jgi:hypothetical protein
MGRPKKADRLLKKATDFPPYRVGLCTQKHAWRKTSFDTVRGHSWVLVRFWMRKYENRLAAAANYLKAKGYWWAVAGSNCGLPACK